jgi:flagellar motor switch protein FliN
MMKLRQWKHALLVQIPGLELILKNMSGRTYSFELKNTGSLGAEDAKQQMQEADILVRFDENNFQSEILLGFNSAWIGLLAEEEDQRALKKEEVREKLIKKFSANIMNIITSALAEAGIEVDIAQIDTIKGKQKSAAFNHEKYFSARLVATSDSENDNEQTEASPFEFWIALSSPDKKQWAVYEKRFEEDNPFVDDRFSELMAHNASLIYPVQDSDDTDSKSSNNTNNNGSIPGYGQKVEFEDFNESKTIKNGSEVHNIDILKNVEMQVSVVLGQRKMPLGNILKLVKGSVIELEKLAGEPVEILVNGHKIAQGDVVVINENFGVRISNLLASQEHIKAL